LEHKYTSTPCTSTESSTQCTNDNEWTLVTRKGTMRERKPRHNWVYSL